MSGYPANPEVKAVLKRNLE